MHPALVLEPALEPALRAWGLPVVRRGQPADHDLVAMGDDWDRLRQWRLGGHGFRAVALAAAPPPDRAVLEPLAVVREPTAEAIGEALASLEAGRRQGELALASGTVDLGRRVLRHPDGTTALSRLVGSLLAYLAARPGRGISRELLRQVWGRPGRPARAPSTWPCCGSRRKIDRHAGPRPPPVELRRRLPAGRPRRARRRPGRTRTHLLDAIVARLDSGVGRLALHGLPGVGKSRLARALPARLPRPPPWWTAQAPPPSRRCARGSGRALALAVGDAADLDLAAAPVDVLVLDDVDGVDDANRRPHGRGLARARAGAAGRYRRPRRRPPAPARLAMPRSRTTTRRSCSAALGREVPLRRPRAGLRSGSGCAAEARWPRPLPARPLATSWRTSSTRSRPRPALPAGWPCRSRSTPSCWRRSPPDSGPDALAALEEAGLVRREGDGVVLPGAVRAWAAPRVAPDGSGWHRRPGSFH
ncbi:MAG: hypothetical protein R3F59_24120 [Myxococcota bacterium]